MILMYQVVTRLTLEARTQYALQMDNKALYSTLTLAGVTPFLACALLPFIGITELPSVGPLNELANSYAMAIVCFLTGIHWATYLYRQHEVALNLMAMSNIVFLFAWFAYVLSATAVSLGAQLVALVVLLLIDGKLKADGLISAHYFRTRSIATALAVGSLLLMLVR